MIGDKIKTLRMNMGITQETLAKHLFVSPQAVSKWEQNAAMPDVAMLLPLADYLGVTVDSLLRCDDEKLDVGRWLEGRAIRKGASRVYDVSVKNCSEDYVLWVDMKVKFKNAGGETVDYWERTIRNLEPAETKSMVALSTLNEGIAYAEVCFGKYSIA